jgi:hypothetical protein
LFALFGVLCLTFDGVIVPLYTSQIEITPLAILGSYCSVGLSVCFSRDASGIHHLLFLVVYRNCQYISQLHLLLSTEIFPSGFTSYRKDRKTDSHGGVFILVSDKYLSSEPTDLKSDDSSEQLWVKLQVLAILGSYCSVGFSVCFSGDAPGIHHLLLLVVYRNCQYISQVHLLLGALPIIDRLSRLILSL